MEYIEDEKRWVDSEPCCGCKAEIFTFKALERCFEEAKDAYCIEHVTPYLYMNPDLFIVGGRGSHYEGANILTEKFGTDLDTPEDIILLRKIYESLYPKNPAFSTQDIINLMVEHPKWQDIIRGIKRTPVTYHGEGESRIIYDTGLCENV